MKYMKDLKFSYFIIFIAFIVKTTNGQNRSGCENVITVSYLLLYRDSKKMGDTGFFTLTLMKVFRYDMV